MYRLIFICISFLGVTFLNAQNTIGLLSYNPEKALDGYLLLYPQNQGTAFLINNCGEVVHKWIDDLTGPSNCASLQEDGSIFMAKIDYNYTNPWIFAGGAGQKIEHRDWDNQLLWTFQYADSMKRIHHNFTVLPNGNVVLIAWERKDINSCLAVGKDTSMMVDEELWPDHLVEIQPIGLDSGLVVWEWHAWDHLIQDVDPLKPNYGIIADHPERININYTNNNNNADWIHFNSIDYNPVLDQLIVSSPTLNEVWIIDHSTTTSEAASQTGGNSGKGGDLIYRWGNPQAYNRGTNLDRKLGFQHDIHWTDLELPNGHPDKGKLMVFNNNYQQNVSAANTFQPVFDTINQTYQMQNNVYLPLDFDYTYTAPVASDIYCAVVSSAQRLSNGNTLICSGRKGYSREVDSLGTIVWEYKTPINNSVPVAQGTIIPISGNFTFRTKKYSAEFPGFIGKNLSSIGFIELNPDTTFCPSLLSLDINQLSSFSFFPNPTNKFISVKGIPENFKGTLSIFSITGTELMKIPFNFKETQVINLEDFESGCYFIQFENESGQKISKQVVKK